MPKLLVLRQDILPYSETFIREQILACRRWQPVLAGLREVDGLTRAGLDLRILQDPRRPLPERLQWQAMRRFGWPPWQAVRRLRRENAQLIHMHFGFDAVALWPLIRALNLPVAITLHGYDINISRAWWEDSDDAFTRLYPRRLLALARKPNVHFIAVSEAIRQQAIAYGIPAARIAVHYIGVDIARFRPGPPLLQRRKRILFTGRMVEKKGPTYLIEAFARLRAAVPAAELAMIGDGPLLAPCRELAQKLNVPVEFTGSLAAEAVKAQLDAARVFCLPSITAENGDAEGLGIVILEAQACGVPVVTSARGGATEGIIHGETGFAFPEKDVGALADDLTRLLRDDDLAQAMSAKAPQFIAGKFDLRICTQALEDYYDRLAQGAA